MNYGIMLALAGMVLAGLGDFFLKQGVSKGNDANALMFNVFVIVTVLFGVLCLALSSPLGLKTPVWEHSLAVGFFGFAGLLAFMAAIKRGEASIVVPIARIGFVVTVVCAFVFLKEPLTLQRGLGILFAIFAILLLARK